MTAVPATPKVTGRGGARGDETHSSAPDGADEWDLDHLLAARDRVAAALDRIDAAVALKLALDYQRQAYRDSLTGVLQRDAGWQRLSEEVARVTRTSGSLVVGFLDVVGLKTINDTFGHAVGDTVLAAVGAALTAGLRPYDVVLRYGGDEFICGVPDTPVAAASRRLAKVRATLSGSVPPIRLSVGLAVLQPGESLQSVVRRADRHLYDKRRLEASRQTGPRLAAHPPALDARPFADRHDERASVATCQDLAP